MTVPKWDFSLATNNRNITFPYTTIWQHWRSDRYTQTAMSQCDLDRAYRE